MPDPDAAPPKYVVTLVHGTFAKGAAWTQDGSALREQIGERLGEGAVRFEPFEWSGWNSDNARHKAARELRTHLERSFAAHPAAIHYLVAHSHGGNVTLHALRGFADADRVAGVVCIATPFIHCQPREVVRAVRALGGFVQGAWLLVCLYLWALVPVMTAGVTLLTWLAGVALLSFWVFRKHGPVARWVERAQVAVARRYNPAVRLGVPFLCVHATRDEPGRVLGVVSLLSESPYFFHRVLAFFARLAKWSTGLLALTSVVLVAVWFVRAAEAPATPQPADTGVSLLGQWCIITPILALASLAAWVVLAALCMVLEALKVVLPGGVRRLAFGTTGLSTYWLARYWTEPVPFGVTRLTVKPYVFPVPLFVRLRTLMHSFIYTDPGVLRDMATWLLEAPQLPTVLKESSPTSAG